MRVLQLEKENKSLLQSSSEHLPRHFTVSTKAQDPIEDQWEPKLDDIFQSIDFFEDGVIDEDGQALHAESESAELTNNRCSSAASTMVLAR